VTEELQHFFIVNQHAENLEKSNRSIVELLGQNSLDSVPIDFKNLQFSA
jgi:hypothetical protein